jgi:hypothetical protein
MKSKDEGRRMKDAYSGFVIKAAYACSDCACVDCGRFSDCDIRDKCSDCRPMVLLFCSERRDA